MGYRFVVVRLKGGGAALWHNASFAQNAPGLISAAKFAPEQGLLFDHLTTAAPFPLPPPPVHQGKCGTRVYLANWPGREAGASAAAGRN